MANTKIINNEYTIKAHIGYGNLDMRAVEHDKVDDMQLVANCKGKTIVNCPLKQYFIRNFVKAGQGLVLPKNATTDTSMIVLEFFPTADPAALQLFHDQKASFCESCRLCKAKTRVG